MRTNAMGWRWLARIVCCALLVTACHVDGAAEETTEDSPPLDGRVADIRALIVAEPTVIEDAFSQTFLNQIPAGTMKEIGKGFFAGISRMASRPRPSRAFLTILS